VTVSRSSKAKGAAEPLAFIGVRACELRAIAIHDRVFLSGPYLDNSYKSRRDQNFIVAVRRPLCSLALAPRRVAPA
jgi:hypothetical protein